VFVARRLHEKPLAQIAEEMGLSVSTVEKHLGVALAAFMKALAQQEQEVIRVGKQPDSAASTDEEEAIRHLLALENGASEAERQAAEQWIAASPGHAVAFARARQAWRAAAGLDAEPEVPSGDLDTGQQRASRGGVLLGSAGVLGLVLAASGGWFLLHRQLLTTRVGEIREVALPDGSHVVLNSDTVVEVGYTREQRRLRLKRGEAFFEVAHNPARPFDVEVGETTLRALGTAFNVRDRGAVVELTVSHGVVGVREGSPRCARCRRAISRSSTPMPSRWPAMMRRASRKKRPGASM
jgi:ferric-dicitrate binding protein FerR (iron transport regulator)